MEDSSSAVHGAHIFENPTISTVLWITAAVFFLLCPFFASSSRRKRCAARIRQRRWNVGQQQNRDWYREVAARMEERSRHRIQNGLPTQLTVEEEEEIRQIFLIQQLSQYTMTISSADIKMRSNAEKDTDVETGDLTTATSAAKDIIGDDTDSYDNDCVVEFEQSDRIVTVVAAGESVWPLDRAHKTRDVANGCAICLCEYEARDQITWSANKDCAHVFHSDCILHWQRALGRKEQKRRRQHPERSTGDPIKDVVTFPMLCPCCRQQFINTPDDIPSLTTELSSLFDSTSTEESHTETDLAEEVQATAMTSQQDMESGALQAAEELTADRNSGEEAQRTVVPFQDVEHCTTETDKGSPLETTSTEMTLPQEVENGTLEAVEEAPPETHAAVESQTIVIPPEEVENCLSEASEDVPQEANSLGGSLGQNAEKDTTETSVVDDV